MGTISSRVVSICRPWPSKILHWSFGEIWLLLPTTISCGYSSATSLPYIFETTNACSYHNLILYFIDQTLQGTVVLTSWLFCLQSSLIKQFTNLLNHEFFMFSYYLNINSDTLYLVTSTYYINQKILFQCWLVQRTSNRRTTEGTRNSTNSKAESNQS